VVAHGNSLRSLVKDIEDLNEEEIVKVEIDATMPIAYDMDSNAKVIKKEVL